VPSLTSSPPTVSPRLATPRDPSRPSDGSLGAFVAQLHGRPWLPHQRLAADVLGELTPAGTYVYGIGVVLLPRQTGKTTFVMDLALGRALAYVDYRCAYAAQTGHVTTERMVERIEELEAGPMGPRARLRRSAGTERITLPGRSYLKAFPPKAGALRSNALDLVIVDEAQEHGVTLGAQLDLTILPVFSTRPRRQLILVGTAGTDQSDYLLRYLAAAQARLPGYCVVEYGALGGEDVDDQEMWPRRHPGLAYGLTDTAYLANMRETMGVAGFGREFFNVWSRTADRAVDPADWAGVQDPAATEAGPVAFGLDVAADRGSAAIGVADGTGYLELVDHHDGTDWVVARVLELQARHHQPLTCTRYGASGATVDALERAGADLVVMTGGDVANATADTLDAIATRTLRVVPSPALTEAVEGAALRTLADTGGVAWSRRDSASNVAPLVAVTAARWGALHHPGPPARPVVAAL
jgi:hypothetical protein